MFEEELNILEFFLVTSDFWNFIVGFIFSIIVVYAMGIIYLFIIDYSQGFFELWKMFINEFGIYGLFGFIAFIYLFDKIVSFGSNINPKLKTFLSFLSPISYVNYIIQSILSSEGFGKIIKDIVTKVVNILPNQMKLIKEICKKLNVNCNYRLLRPNKILLNKRYLIIFEPFKYKVFKVQE